MCCVVFFLRLVLYTVCAIHCCSLVLVGLFFFCEHFSGTLGRVQIFLFLCGCLASFLGGPGGVPRINVVVFTGNLLRDTVVRRSCIFMPQGAKVAPKIFQIGHFGPQKQYGEPGVLQILAPHPKIPWPFSSMRKL